MITEITKPLTEEARENLYRVIQNYSLFRLSILEKVLSILDIDISPEDLKTKKSKKSLFSITFTSLNKDQLEKLEELFNEEEYLGSEEIPQLTPLFDSLGWILHSEADRWRLSFYPDWAVETWKRDFSRGYDEIDDSDTDWKNHTGPDGLTFTQKELFDWLGC